jgi:N-acetylglucosamine-6-sulfatase
MRAALLAGVLALVCLAAAAQPLSGVVPPSPSTPAVAAPKPNFVMIFLDDMRADELVAMPYTSQMIGAQGATFDHAYAPYPLCCPARATILSGQYPHNNHVFGNLPPTGGVTAFDDRRTIGTWLKRHGGYRTAYVGKYLNRYGQDTRRRHRPHGWTTWNALVRHWYNYRGFAMNIDRYVVRYMDEYQSDVMGELSTDFITDESGPFLLVAGFLAPHSGGPPEPDDTRGALDGCFATDLCSNTTPAVADEYRNTEAGHRLPRSPAYDEADVSDKPAHIRALPPLVRTRSCGSSGWRPSAPSTNKCGASWWPCGGQGRCGAPTSW